MTKSGQKLEIELPYDTAIPLLGIHTEETRIERDTCTPMFIAALFTIARTWNQPRCPLADVYVLSMDKKSVVHILKGILAIKKNTFESVLMRWMKLEPITSSEVSQNEKHQYSISTVQLLSHVRLFATPWTATRQASLSITNSRSPPKLMSIKSVMSSNHLILCHPLLFPPSTFPSIRVFSNDQFFTSGGQNIGVSAST